MGAPAQKAYTAPSSWPVARPPRLCAARAAPSGHQGRGTLRPPQLHIPSVVLRHVLWSREPDRGALTMEPHVCSVCVLSLGKPVSPLSRWARVKC